jgi:hypothetical protein
MKTKPGSVFCHLINVGMNVVDMDDGHFQVGSLIQSSTADLGMYVS